MNKEQSPNSQMSKTDMTIPQQTLSQSSNQAKEQTSVTQVVDNQSKKNQQKKSGKFAILSILGLAIGGWLAVTSYQTLFGKIEQQKQMVEVSEGQTLYGMMDMWQQKVPMFSPTIAKLYIKAKAGDGLHLGSYQFQKIRVFRKR